MNIVLPINYVTFAVFLTIFSCLSLFFGAKLFKIIIAIIGIFIGLFVISPVVTTYIPSSSNIAFLVGIISGIILALISLFFFYAGIASIGVFLGFMILKLLNIEITSSNQYITIIVITIITLIFILVAKQFTEIIITSIIGGVFLSNCLYFLYLYYIDKQYKLYGIDINKYIEIIKGSNLTYLTLLCVALFLTIVGIVFQAKNSKNRSKK